MKKKLLKVYCNNISFKEAKNIVVNMFFDEDSEEITRIISARKATQKERNFYEQN